MRNFLKLAGNVNVTPLLHAIHRQPELWNENTLRTTHESSPHTAVDDIWLRFNDIEPYETGASEYTSLIDEHESIFYPAWYALPEAHAIVFDLMAAVKGVRLGRVLITRLPAGEKIDAHADGGSHAAYYERYHCILKNNPGSNFRAGDETICLQAGDVYWFDNSQEHEVINYSDDDRITMIVDIRCVR